VLRVAGGPLREGWVRVLSEDETRRLLGADLSALREHGIAAPDDLDRLNADALPREVLAALLEELSDHLAQGMEERLGHLAPRVAGAGDVTFRATLRHLGSLLLRGRVVDAAGRPLPGAEVIVFSEEGIVVTEAGPDAVFEVEVAPGEAQVRVDYPGWAPRLDALELSPGQPELVLELERGVAMRGRVVPPRDDVKTVVATPAGHDPFERGLVVTAEVAPAGTFDLGRLAAGAWELRLELAGGRGPRGPFQVTLEEGAEAREVELPSGR